MGSDRFSKGLMKINTLIVKSAQQLSTYREGSDRKCRGLMEVIPVITDRGLMDLVGV